MLASRTTDSQGDSRTGGLYHRWFSAGPWRTVFVSRLPQSPYDLAHGAGRPGYEGAPMAPRAPKNVPVRPVKGADSWEGLLSVHPRGFGFVSAAGQDDVFVPPEA